MKIGKYTIGWSRVTKEQDELLVTDPKEALPILINAISTLESDINRLKYEIKWLHEYFNLEHDVKITDTSGPPKSWYSETLGLKKKENK